MGHAKCKECLLLHAQSPPSDITIPGEEEMIVKRANNNSSRVPATQVCHSDSTFTVDKKDTLESSSPMSQAKQIDVLFVYACASPISFATLQFPDIRADAECTIRFNTIMFGPIWPTTYIRLSHNAQVVPKTVTSTAISDHVSCLRFT